MIAMTDQSAHRLKSLVHEQGENDMLIRNFVKGAAGSVALIALASTATAAGAPDVPSKTPK